MGVICSVIFVNHFNRHMQLITNDTLFYLVYEWIM